MKTVTGIEPCGKERASVYLDGELAFVLYRGELSRYGIQEGADISQAVYDQLLGEVLLKRAQARSLNILKNMDKTEAQMRRKLEEGKYPPSVIDATIQWLYGYHYLDDRRYAENYIAQKKGSRSKRQIFQDLSLKGVPGEVIEETYSREEPEDETELIRKWVEKKHVDPETADDKELRKLYQFLLRKGFRPGDIAKVFSSIT